MMLLLQVEWLRFRRLLSNLLVCALLLVLLGVSAWFAGHSASDYRQLEQMRTAAWHAHIAKVRVTLSELSGPESAEAARMAYEFGREQAPPALRPAPGGLVLAVRQFRLQPYDVKVSIDSRHLDPRRGAPLGNPLLDSFGVPDFAVVIALLIPLAVTALCYGIVHDAREMGIWPLIRAQMAAPLRLLAAALAVRLMAVLAIAVLASVLAFSLDPLANWGVCLIWIGFTAVYTLLWVALAGLFNLLNLSSAASALALIALSLVLGVVVPALFGQYAAGRASLPSRETTVVEVRQVQHEAEERMAELLDDWYARHPEQRPASVINHTWPVTYVPKIAWQDGRIGQLMRDVDRARTAQAGVLEPLLWAAPGLALCRVADRLAGADPEQYQLYVERVERLESQWRSALSPAVMSYRGVTLGHLDRIASVDAGQAVPSADVASLGLALLTAACVLIALSIGLARRS